MPPTTECRLLIDPPCPGAWNMAVDEVLLEWSAQEGGCCWRFYGWDEPTLSLGFFQDYGEREEHAASRRCAAVRRLTGGGAILHDRELTYSIVVAAGHPLALRRNALYETIHTSLIDVLADFGVSAGLCDPAQRGTRGNGDRREPFLCFQRRAPGDVLVGATKVAGSAQRRRRGAVLQHGSVLLGCSTAAPELAALNDLTDRSFDPDGLAEAWLAELSQRMAVEWCRQPLSGPQRQQATTLLEDRYATSRWTQYRGRQATGARSGG